MKRDTFHTGTASVTTACYEGPGRRELHAVITPDPGQCPSLDSCLKACDDAASRLASDCGLVIAFTRLHLSDIVNQARGCPGRIVTGQAPLCRAKAAMLAILIEGAAVAREGAITVVKRSDTYSDFWYSFTSDSGVAPREAITNAFDELGSALSARGLSVADACHRTWLWVRDIDTTYKEIVAGRNQVFRDIGLWSGTHFIASTGIGADTPSPQNALRFDALSVGGLDREQVSYIKAPGHLNDTIDYGVAFERATAIAYGDRRVVYVSGTASIDSRGRIVAPDDIVGQTYRMSDNVDALLRAAAATAADLMHIILYVRDPADVLAATAIVAEHFPGVPCLAVRAPVCRPGWLVEMECVAMAPAAGDHAPY